MANEALIEHTVARFPRFAARSIAIEPVEKGGSDRRYYRVRITDEHSLILVKYGDGREENRHYVSIARFLAGLGIAVPEIYFHDEEEGLIWMEDLGERDLWSYRDEPWESRGELYGGALDELVKLHTLAHRSPTHAGLALQPEFDADLYRWEQEYFIENCLRRHFGCETPLDRAPLTALAEMLGEQPRVLVHRDFQSQNIMIPPRGDGRAFLIDFQGLRPGLGQYDLASLIYDPYVALSGEERASLVDGYISRTSEAGVRVTDEFSEILDLCAAQRLMQALGAYGFLGLVKGRAHFLEHIPRALAALREVAARIPQMDGLSAVLAALPGASDASH
jgi:aminoglycoside/choline kinase family phosphotransferase